MSAKKRNSYVTGFLKRLREDTSGNTLAMMAAAMVPLAGMIGGGLDISRAYMAKAKLQNACDAGALAARQGMTGTNFTNADRLTAERFFDFNFPAGTMAAEDIDFDIQQDAGDVASLEGVATATIPTSLMKIFSYNEIDIAVDCNVKRDLGNNDIMVVLDVTGSMNCDPGHFPNHVDCDGDSNSKIARLRNGALGLYRALQDGTNTSRTRFGLIPYSSSINVGRRLRTRDILRTTDYDDCTSYSGSYCLSASKTGVHINSTQWSDDGANTGQRIRAWRQSGSACVEERPTIGNAASPIRISTDVSQDDIDLKAANGNDTQRQWGRYDPAPQNASGSTLVNRAHSQVACPAEAQKLRTYGSEAAFQTAIDNATSIVTGGTYHDIGMIWAARWLSQTGMFSANNPTEVNGFPVNTHVVFMTDGTLDVGSSLYSSYGISRFEDRLTGTGNQSQKHRSRFLSACSRARAMNMTIWVVALDVGDPNDPNDPAVADIKPCATSTDHFYTSDGSDLEEVFAKIGQGIGDLRLTL
ncbi:MAG: TadE/TadG family type IV pilus assembly protein [Parasphingorhabdus sp.]